MKTFLSSNYSTRPRRGGLLHPAAGGDSGAGVTSSGLPASRPPRSVCAVAVYAALGEAPEVGDPVIP